MKNKIENEILTLYFEGELNSYNSEQVEKEIEEIIEKKGFKAIRIDMNDLVYISSAGLRIIVRIKQMCNDLVLVNVPKDVNDILEMVGFNNLISIEKK